MTNVNAKRELGWFARLSRAIRFTFMPWPSGEGFKRHFFARWN